jgi:PAS domain S-box-containing protein
MNSAVSQVLGYSLGEVLGKTPQDFVHPDDMGLVNSLIQEALAHPGHPLRLSDFRVRRSDGSWVYMEAVSTALPDVPGIEGIVASCRDITERRLVEDERRRADQLTGIVSVYMARSPLSVVLWTVADGTIRVVDWGRVSEKTFGWTKAEVLGRDFFDFLIPESTKPDIRQVVEQLSLDEFPDEHENECMTCTGDRKVIHWFNSPLSRSPNNELTVLSLGEDVTERRRDERELRDLFDEAPVAYHELDTEGRVCRVNRTERALLGYTFEEMQGRFFWEFVRDADTSREAILEKLQGRLELGSFERILRRKDGSSFPAIIEDRILRDELGRITGIRSTLQDITAWKKAERELQDSVLLFRSLAENIPGIVYLCENDRGYSMRYLSRQFESITGYPREMCTEGGMPYADLIHREDLAGVHREIDDAVEDHRSFHLLYRLRRCDGSWRWAEEYGTPLYDEETGAANRLEGLVLDVTEERQREEEHKKLQAQMQHAQKLESLGVLAGGIAHDFNNLLTGILGNADLALSELSDLSPARQNLEEIETASRRAADLCRQMLAYSGRGKFVIRAVDLTEVVREMVHLLEVSISKKAILRFNFENNLPAVEADVTQLRQIVMNLITNASDAIGDRSGIISVATGAVQCDRAYLSETYLDDDLPEGCYVFVEVTDTGCGMDRETRVRIFEPFFTTKFAGRGLGLAAVLGIVRGHRGALKVYSELGKGSSFKALFPAVAATAEPMNEASRPRETWTGAGTVLVVDDEETVRALARRSLERHGFGVLTASDGVEGVAIFREHCDEIVAVLLDMTMPRMGGEDTFRELRRIRSEVRVILSSGYNEQEAISHFVGKGLSGFIQKPYQSRELIAKLREILE